MGNIFNNTSNLQALLDIANNLPEANDGVELPTLINEGSASDLLMDKEFIDSEGKIVIGTMPSTAQATPSISIDSNGLITATATQNAGYVNGGTKSATKQLAFQPAKTITPSTTSQIAVSSGYYTGGDITIAGDSNLVAENIKSGISIFGINGTAQVGDDVLQAIVEKTITSFENSNIKTIGSYMFYKCTNLTTVSFPACTRINNSAFYNCSNLTSVYFPACTTLSEYAFCACSNLTTISFPVCTNIFNDAFYGCTNLTSVYFPACTSIDNNAFSHCNNLTTVSFPACTSIGVSAFYYCTKLTTVSFPVCTTIGASAFQNCTNLTTVSFPVCAILSNRAFYACSNLTAVSFPACTTIATSTFDNCYRLSSIILGASTVCTLASSNAFASTPYAGYSSYFSGIPYIYVPASLIDAYKSTKNWSYFSNYFSSIESLE